tara:strand:+ start:108 stop:1337 length:1230 start_codon:yes stop_codon:yes gene_type:complete
MIKISIYTLLIIALTGCASFKGTDESVEIDQKGNVTKKGNEILSAEELYNTAKGALKREQYEVAIENYREIEANYPFSKFAEQSHIELAYAMYKMKNWDPAIAVIDRFMAMNSTSKLLPYAYYLRGLTNFNRGKTFFNFFLPHVHVDKDPVNIKEAYDDFNYIYKNYKNSEYVKDSIKRMVYLRNTLAAYELHVANYYFKRKAYIAVINRCNYLIEKYPEAPANIDALFFLEKSYELLLMTDSSRIINKIIEKNYPEYKSVYFNDVLENKVQRNLVALSELADDIAISMGFDIEDQSVDNFDGIYSVEYFSNENLVEIPRNIKPERYTIIHTVNNKKFSIKDNLEKLSILSYYFKDDESDLIVKDIIVGETIDIKKDAPTKDNSPKPDKKIEELNQKIDSENQVIELLE